MIIRTNTISIHKIFINPTWINNASLRSTLIIRAGWTLRTFTINYEIVSRGVDFCATAISPVSLGDMAYDEISSHGGKFDGVVGDIDATVEGIVDVNVVAHMFDAAFSLAKVGASGVLNMPPSVTHNAEIASALSYLKLPFIDSSTGGVVLSDVDRINAIQVRLSVLLSFLFLAFRFG